MLSNTLNTNEVKDRTGSEVEFTRLSTLGRTTEFAKIGEAPNLPHRLLIAHQETGTGLTKRRQSVVRVNITTAGADGSPVVTSCLLKLDSPIGNLAADTVEKDAIAEVLSFCATTGAASTVLFDCTGNGANALVSGSL